MPDCYCMENCGCIQCADHSIGTECADCEECKCGFVVYAFPASVTDSRPVHLVTELPCKN